MTRHRVAVYGTIDKRIEVEHGATKGATVGVNLFNQDGTLVGVGDIALSTTVINQIINQINGGDTIVGGGGPASTTELPEGSNLYYTDARAYDAIGFMWDHTYHIGANVTRAGDQMYLEVYDQAIKPVYQVAHNFPRGMPIKIDAGGVWSRTSNIDMSTKADALCGFVHDANTFDARFGGPLFATTAEWDVLTQEVGGLVPGADYYLAPLPIRLTRTMPTTGTAVRQLLGTALDTTTMQVHIHGAEPIVTAAIGMPAGGIVNDMLRKQTAAAGDAVWTNSVTLKNITFIDTALPTTYGNLATASGVFALAGQVNGVNVSMGVTHNSGSPQWSFSHALFVAGGYVWTSANDGVGSGLDADKIDGMESSSFAHSTHISANVATNDLNDALQSGMFRFDTPANAPPGVAYSYVIVAHNSGSDTAGQIAIDYATGNVWSRAANVGVSPYRPWAKQWSTENDGPGSGLDADTLDGVQGTGFAQKAVAETITGVWTHNANTNFATSQISANGDFYASRANAPLTGVYHFGNGSSYIYHSGSAFTLQGGPVNIPNWLEVRGGRAMLASSSDFFSIGLCYNGSRRDSGQACYLGASDAATPDLVVLPGGAEQFRVTGDGRVYGKTLHANTAPMLANLTGTANQYVASGVWTPTVGDRTNIAVGATSGLSQFIRVGNVVSFSTFVTCQPSAIGPCRLSLSAPIPSNFSAYERCTGGGGDLSNLSENAALYAEPGVASKIFVSFTAKGTASRAISLSGCYLIE